VEIHFIDVGCGNMVFIRTSTADVVYDCNITDENEGRVIRYLKRIIGSETPIDIFICSHRDADHMRGIKRLHAANPILTIFDNGEVGTDPNCDEYRDYMDLRRRIGYTEIKARTYETYGDTKFRFMNSRWEDLCDPNEQSIVLKLEREGGSSCLLAGDTNYRPWREKILPFYEEKDLKSDILLAPHHGSLDFFDDPSDSRNYYLSHIKAISPAMTLISVGPNVHSLPNKKALELYTKYSTGSNKGNKVYTTEDKGNMRLVLKDTGEWQLDVQQ
jgi:beta-lactamase superfamily II metal-dependent hydrolase